MMPLCHACRDIAASFFSEQEADETYAHFPTGGLRIPAS